MKRVLALGLTLLPMILMGIVVSTPATAEAGPFRFWKLRKPGNRVECPPVVVPVNQPNVVAGELAITNVTVIDVIAGKAKPAQTVVIKGDRIAAVGPAATTRTQEGAKVIDGTGKFLIPGLWDMHAHIAIDAMPALFLRFGVTGVRHMFSPLPGGFDREAHNPSKGPEPAFTRVVGTTQFLDGCNTGYPSNVFRISATEKARVAVHELHKQKSDFVKVHALLTREAYFVTIEEAKKLKLPVVGHVPVEITAAEASDAGQLTIEHLDGVAVLCASPKITDKCLKCLREEYGAAKDPDTQIPCDVELDALNDYQDDRAAALFKKFVQNGTWHVPTLVEMQSKSRLGDKDALSQEVWDMLPLLAKIYWKREYHADGSVRLPAVKRTYTAKNLEDRKKMLKGELELVGKMHKAGVRLLAGTDTPAPLIVPGLSLHDELELFVKAGLTPAEALRTATVNPAECLKMADRLGTVEAGKLADLVLLTKDPLADIRNTRTIEAVLVGGRMVTRPAAKK